MSEAPVRARSVYSYAKLYPCSMLLRENSTLFKSSDSFWRLFSTVSDRVGAVFLLREASLVLPLLLCPAPSPSFGCFEGLDEYSWEPWLAPWPCCMSWQSTPCATWASTELEIWYRDLAVTIQHTGLPVQLQRDRTSQKCQAVVLGPLQKEKPGSPRS